VHAVYAERTAIAHTSSIGNRQSLLPRPALQLALLDRQESLPDNAAFQAGLSFAVTTELMLLSLWWLRVHAGPPTHCRWRGGPTTLSCATALLPGP